MSNLEDVAGEVTTTATKKKKKEKPDFFSFENIRSLVVLVAVIFAIRWSIASPYHVPTASMEPTIKVGDRLLAWKLSYDMKVPFTDISLLSWGTPEKGDIIVFKYPRDPDIDYVKRVVATAGDKIEVIDDVLYVNGEQQVRKDHDHDRSILTDIHDTPEIKELYQETLNGRKHWVLQNKAKMRMFSNRNFGPHVVPEGAVFCMGDNRDNSTDSRIWGEVPLSYVRGKALFVLWSVYKPRDGWFKLRFNRFGHSLY